MLFVNKRAEGYPATAKCRLLGNIPRSPSAKSYPQWPVAWSMLDRETTDSAHHVVDKSRGDKDMTLLRIIAGEDPLHSSAECWKPKLGLAWQG